MNEQELKKLTEAVADAAYRGALRGVEEYRRRTNPRATNGNLFETPEAEADFLLKLDQLKDSRLRRTATETLRIMYRTLSADAPTDRDKRRLGNVVAELVGRGAGVEA